LLLSFPVFWRNPDFLTGILCKKLPQISNLQEFRSSHMNMEHYRFAFQKSQQNNLLRFSKLLDAFYKTMLKYRSGLSFLGFGFPGTIRTPQYDGREMKDA